MLVCSGQAFAAAETPHQWPTVCLSLGVGMGCGASSGGHAAAVAHTAFPWGLWGWQQPLALQTLALQARVLLATGTADTGAAGTGTAETGTAGHWHCRRWHCWPPVLQTPPLQATADWEQQLVQAAACQRRGLRQLGCGHVPCASQGKRLHPGTCSVVSYGNAMAEPAWDGQSSTRPGSRQCLCLQQALPAAFPPSSEGQILSIAPALKSLLPIAVRNSPGLGVSYLCPPVRKEECTELPRPPFPQPHALPSC